MCLAIPARIVELLGDGEAVVDMGGVRKRISLALLDEVGLGAWVIVHVGYALHRLDEAEALNTLKLIAAAGEDADALRQ